MKQSLLKNGIYNTAAGIIRIGLGLLTIPVLIRKLGIEEYGIWTLAVTVIIIVTLAESGLSLATTMFVSQDLERNDIEGLSQTLTITGGAMLILSVMASLFLYFFATMIVGNFGKLQPLQQIVAIQAIQLGAVVVWARLLQQVMVGVEQAFQRYDLSNAVSTIQTFILNIGLLAVVLSGGKTVALMQWQICITLSGLIAHSWLNWFLLQKFRLRMHWNLTRGIEIFRYSMMSWLTAMGGVLFAQMDKVIVGSVLGTSALGLYAAVTTITNQINVLSALPVQPMMPALSALAVKAEFDLVEAEERVKQAYMVNSLFALGIGAILLTIAPFLLNLLLGYEPSLDLVLTFRVAVLAYSLYSVNAVGFYLCLGLNAARTCMTIQVIGSFLALTLIWLGTNHFGLLGAMLGNLGFTSTWLMNIYGCRLLKIQGYKWLQWLGVPLLITGSIFLIGTISTVIPILKLIVMSLLTIGLFVWYLVRQLSQLKSIYVKLQSRLFKRSRLDIIVDNHIEKDPKLTEYIDFINSLNLNIKILDIISVRNHSEDCANGWKGLKAISCLTDTQAVYDIDIRFAWDTQIFEQHLYDHGWDRSTLLGAKHRKHKCHKSIVYLCDPLIDLIDGFQYQVVSKRFIIGNYWQTIEHYYIALPLQHPFDLPELIDINFSKYLPLDIDIPTAITSRKRVKEGGLRTKGITKSSANQQLLISVITVVFNGEEKIEQTIQSVINQDYENYEYIIIDGNSSDRTRDIIRKYADRIDYWQSEKDMGIYDAMNKGIALASGQWLNFMNCGDLFYNERSLSSVPLESDVDFYYSDTILHDSKGKIALRVCSQEKRDIIHQSLVYKKNLHSNYKYLVHDKLTISDYFFFRKYDCKQWSKLDVPLSIYNTEGISGTNSKGLIQKLFVEYMAGDISEFEMSLAIIAKLLRAPLRVIRNIIRKY